MKFRLVTLVIFSFLIISIIMKWSFAFSIFLLVIWLVSLVLGVINIHWNYFIKSTHTLLESDEKNIALTFDDGPNPEFTPIVLDILKENNIKATFFCIGKNSEKYPDLIRRISEEGHTIGNHTYSHSNYIDFKFSKGLIKEINKTDEIIYKIINKKVELFRPPFGVTTPHLAKAIRKTKHKVIGWNIRPYDTSEKFYKKIVEKILYKAQKGDIILLHDTHKQTILVLKEIIPYFLDKKYKFVSL